MNWYKFHAYNSQALYGFGSAEEAEQFCDRLNTGRDINHYAAEIVSAADATGLSLEENTEAFNIEDELVEGSAQ